jgi:hypothetical protein
MQTIQNPRVALLAKQVALFPPAPAGWDLSTLTPISRVGEGLSVVALRDRAHHKVRDLATSLFEQALAEGLLPGEAADAVVEDREYVAARMDFLAWCGKAPIPVPAVRDAKKLFPLGIWAFSPSLGKLLEKAIELENVQTRVGKRLELRPFTINTSGTPETRQRDPFWFLADPVLPNVISRGMYASHRAYAMSAAVDGFTHRPNRAWLSLKQAAEIWMEEARRYLVLLASMPEANVPERVVPLGERVDLAREAAQQALLVSNLNQTA